MNGTLRQRLALSVAAASVLASVSLTPSPTVSARTTTPMCANDGRVAALAFGRVGGNIRPFSVKIFANGRLTGDGMAAHQSHTIKPSVVDGLLALAKAEGFWSMPPSITGGRVLPDIAAVYIMVRKGCEAMPKTVTLHAPASTAMTRHFMELYDTLDAVANPASIM